MDRPDISARALGLAAALPALAAGLIVFYFYRLAVEAGNGFPIDDAYIFRRYAENLARGAGFSFNPHETSFGCTSLLWPMITAFFLRLTGAGYVPLVFALGGVLFAAAVGGISVMVGRAGRDFWLGLFAGLVAAGSPLLFMNAVSGMESPLTFALLALLMALLLGREPRPLSAGVLAGLLTLSRPEGAYFPMAIFFIWILSRTSANKLPFNLLAKFLAGFAVFALPAALWIYLSTGYPLPTTYLGKILSTSPAVTERGIVERLAAAAFSLGDGWARVGARLRLLSAALFAGAVYEFIRAWRGFRAGKDMWPMAGRIALFGFLFLPAAYGLSFPVGPAFGGYYSRYIAPMMVALAALGVMGIDSMGRDFCERARVPVFIDRHWRMAATVVFTAYLAWLTSFQFDFARADFSREIRLNEGLRKKAALWIRDNTGKDARIMAGYTGLGVIGFYADRHALDQGALINPDIFDYYRRAGARPQAKWDAVVEYMRDKGVDYYVTFAFTGALSEVVIDPATTPGLVEVKRLGVEGEPDEPYQQIRVYRVGPDPGQK